MWLLLAGGIAARAESWCASPLFVHEWGVLTLRADGRAAAPIPVPSWFHASGSGTGPLPGAVPVRTLPADGGERALPVVQLYSPKVWADPIPFALEVGFAHGEASAWYPEVDRRRPRALDGSPQLSWEALSLSHAAPASVQPAEQPWVEALRRTPEALWVGRGSESDRFVFYEADTRERPAVEVQRRADGAWTVRNRSDWTVHDIVLIDGDRVARTPGIPPGTTLALRPEPLDRAAVLDWLRQRWTDPHPADLANYRWDLDDCVMMRNPADASDRASGHRLYGAEVDLLLSVWGDRFVASGEPRVIYREDTAALDALVPLAAYTDMYHFVVLERLGVALVEGGW